MPTPNESFVKEVLAKNERDVRLRAAIEESWRDCKDRYPERAWWRRKSTTAHVMWEQAVQNISAQFSGEDGFQYLPHHDTASFIFDDVVFLRSKRSGLNLFTRNYPTQLALLFHLHKADLFGFEGHHRVELVHVFNRFLTDLEWVGIVAREKKTVLWNFELPQGGAEVVAFPEPIGQAPVAADDVFRPTAPAEESKDAEKDAENEQP
jgi:hypothetical protein